MSSQKVKQKFHRGDLVYVANQTGCRSHFTGGCEALVDGSYADVCSAHFNPNSDSAKHQLKQYSLFLLLKTGPYRVAWYNEEDLRLREPRTLHYIEWAERLNRKEQR